MDWNFAFLEVGAGLLLTCLLSLAVGVPEFLDGALASRFNLCALPITALRVVSPKASAIWLAVWPFVQSSFNFSTFSSVQLIVYFYCI